MTTFPLWLSQDFSISAYNCVALAVFVSFARTFSFLPRPKLFFLPLWASVPRYYTTGCFPALECFNLRSPNKQGVFFRQKRHHNWDWFSTICNDNGITLPEYWVMQQKSKLSFLQCVSGTIWELFDRQPLVNFLVWVHYSPRSINRMHYIYYII